MFIYKYYTHAYLFVIFIIYCLITDSNKVSFFLKKKIIKYLLKFIFYINLNHYFIEKKNINFEPRAPFRGLAPGLHRPSRQFWL